MDDQKYINPFVDLHQQQLAKSLEVALEAIRLQEYEIQGLKTMLFALRDSVASGKPPLPFEDANRQVHQEMRESGHNAYDILALLNQHLEAVRDLLKGQNESP